MNGNSKSPEALLSELKGKKDKFPYTEKQYKKLRFFILKAKVKSLLERLKIYQLIVLFTKKVIYPILIAVIGFLLGSLLWVKYFK